MNRALSVTRLSDDLSSGKLESGELCHQAVFRANDSSDLNAFISIAGISEVAKAAMEAKGTELGGIPIAVKDNIDVLGLPNSGGTPALRNWHPSTDALAITRLKRAGAVVIGKTNLHELAAGITSNNRHYGPVRNPHNRDLIAGGSSGGSAAAVSAGVVPIALGTDTAGSCRIPAALTGCVGFRPTIGRYPMDGVLPLSITRDTIGLFARDVPSIQVFDSVLAASERPKTGLPNLKGVRFGVPRAYFFDNLDQSLSMVVDAALEKLRTAGATLVETEVMNVAQLNGDISLPLILYESLRDISTYLNRHRSKRSAWEVADQMAGPFERSLLQNELTSNAVPHSVYLKIIETGRPALVETYRRCFEEQKLDALVFPTTPLPACRIGEDEVVMLNGNSVPTLPTYMRNVDPSAVAGLPSISVPAGKTAAGLPVGLNFDGIAGSDAKILEIASAFEQIARA